MIFLSSADEDEAVCEAPAKRLVKVPLTIAGTESFHNSQFALFMWLLKCAYLRLSCPPSYASWCAAALLIGSARTARTRRLFACRVADLFLLPGEEEETETQT